MIFSTMCSLKNLWDTKGYEIIISASILFLIFCILYRAGTGQSGKWDSYIISMMGGKSGKELFNSNVPGVRRPPQESRGEQETRRVLEEMFNKPFPKKRPNFLKNPIMDGQINLELDCYNEELGIAAEYNGIQHYKYSPYFHSSKEAFHNQKYRDLIKRRACADNGIFLIEIPYNIPIHNIKDFIVVELNKHKK